MINVKGALKSKPEKTKTGMASYRSEEERKDPVLEMK